MFEKSAIDSIENTKNNNRDCKIDPPIDMVWDPRDIEKRDNFLEKEENYSIDHESEESKGNDDKWESQYFKNWLDKSIEYSENHPSNQVELPSAKGDYFWN